MIRAIRRGDALQDIVAHTSATQADIETLQRALSSVASQADKGRAWKSSVNILIAFLCGVFVYPIAQAKLFPLLPGPLVTADLVPVQGRGNSNGCAFYILELNGDADEITRLNVFLNVHGELASHLFVSGTPEYGDGGTASGVIFNLGKVNGKCVVAGASGAIDPEFREIDNFDNVRLTANNPQPHFYLAGSIVVNRTGDITPEAPTIDGSTYEYQKFGVTVSKPIQLVPYDGKHIFTHLVTKNEPSHYTFKVTKTPEPGPEPSAGSVPR